MRKIALLLLMATSLAWAQAPDTPSRVRSLLARSEAQPGAAPRSSAAPVSASAQAVAPVDPVSVADAAKRAREGRRDPFLSPVVERSAGPAGCSTGKRCLVIDQMVLRGVIRTVDGMIAVVANSANKAYFLREKDPVFNGVVVKITGDSVVFRENTVDQAGHTGTREVVKKVIPTPSA